jgi:hypothetical protein
MYTFIISLLFHLPIYLWFAMNKTKLLTKISKFKKQNKILTYTVFGIAVLSDLLTYVFIISKFNTLW